MLSIADLSLVQKVHRALSRHGLRNSLQRLLLRLLGATMQIRILRGLYIERADPVFAGRDARCGFPPGKALRRFAANPASEMSSAFVRQALRRGDQAYGICEGHELLTYGWYATRPTPIDPPELVLHCDPRYVYMYKGFTLPAHRGRRLYAVVVTRALQHFLDLGYAGLVSYIDATNLDSLKACYRMGYRLFGSIYVIRLFGRHFAFSSPGCRPFGFRLEVAASAERAARGNRPERLDPPVADAYIPVVKVDRRVAMSRH